MIDTKTKEKIKILILSSVWVEPNSSAAGSRMLQLIEVFQSQNWQITYASTAAKSEFAYDISKLGINTSTIEINNPNFDNFLKETQPTIVLFDRFIVEEQFGWRVAEILPNTLRILDTEDLHCLRKTREEAIKKNKPFAETDLLKSKIAKREIASILRCDISLIISTYEIEILKNLFKIDISLLQYVPFLLDELKEETIKKTPTFKERKDLYFVGNFLHNPNYDTVIYLKTEIWPKLSKELPKATLHIYGAYTTQKVNQLHNKKERFIINGRAQNLNEKIQNYKICLAPIRFGAGIKGKFIEAMQNGTPSITTKIGAEAMHKNYEWNGCIADNPTAIINTAKELYTSESIWNKSQQNGTTIINNCYNKKQYSQLLITKIIDTQKRLKKHRLNNFIGSLLQHHTLNSTKYLSKWIESKNFKKN